MPLKLRAFVILLAASPPMAIDQDLLASTIRAFLEDELRLEPKQIGADTPLVSSGLVDSAGLVRLAGVIEAATGVMIPDRDVNADNFDTIRRIQAYIAGRVR